MNQVQLHVINVILSLGIILAQVFIVLVIIGFTFFKKKFFVLDIFLRKYGIFAAFVVSLCSVAASLFYSNIAGFAPCELCWFQRIFMYPLVILLAFALIKKDKNITDAVLALPVIGAAISLYHNYLYYAGSVGCQLAGRGVSCTQRYVFEFGYITIPLMALTAFILIIVLLFFVRLPKNHSQ